jgi:hypothetical protein
MGGRLTDGTSNIFDLYHDHPLAPKATKEMKAAVQRFATDVARINKKYVKTGIDDTASRDVLIDYVILKAFRAKLIKR